MKKKKNYLPIIIISCVAVILLVVLLIVLLNNKKKEETTAKDAVFIGNFIDYIETDKKVLTSYDEYIELFGQTEIDSNIFNDKNYALIEIAYEFIVKPSFFFYYI